MNLASLLVLAAVLISRTCVATAGDDSTWLYPESISSSFRRYSTDIADGCAVNIPAWILTPLETSRHSGSFHRFFDSSAFSPSGRYVGFFRTRGEDFPVSSGMTGTVMMVDLLTGEESIIAETKAWDSQLGAQVSRAYVSS